MGHIIEVFARDIFNRSNASKQGHDWNNNQYEMREPYLALASAHLKLLAALNRDDDVVNAMRDFRADAANNAKG